MTTEQQLLEEVIKQLKEENILPSLNAIENRYREEYDDTFILSKQKRKNLIEKYENLHEPINSKEIERNGKIPMSNESIMKKCEQELKSIQKKLISLSSNEKGKIQN